MDDGGRSEERIFDGLLSGPARFVADPSLLLDFGTAALVAQASPDEPGPPSAEGLLFGFTTLLDSLLPRLRAAGVSAWAALGVGSGAHGCRSLHRVLHRLASLLDRPEVVAVGEVGLGGGAPHELDLLVRQATLAGERDLPLLLNAGAAAYEGPAALARALDRLLAEGFPPQRVLVCGPDEPAAELAVACGCWLGLRVEGPLAQARATLELGLAHAPRRTVLCSDLSLATGDVLALARAQRYAQGRLRASERRALFADNAERFYGLALPQGTGGSPPSAGRLRLVQ